MDIKITLMSMNDYDAVYELWTSTTGMGMNSIDDSYDGINKFILRNPTTNFVAKINENEDEKVVGVIMCGHDGRRGHIYHLAVDETCRNNGIGTQLVEHVIESLRIEGITKVSLVAFKTNEVGNLFWNKVGFDERTDLTYRNKSL